MSRKSLKLWLAVGLLLAVSGCGGDDEKQSTTSAPETQTEQIETDPADTEAEPERTEPEPEPTETEEQPPKTSPEEAPGGGGDEEPARSLALFTGAGGRITPPVVRVPSFISIRVELRSTDGRPYALRFGGETIRVSAGLASVSTTIDGLRPGASLVGVPVGQGTGVRIEATAEPGP